MKSAHEGLRQQLARTLEKGTPLRSVLDELYEQIPEENVRFALFGGYLRDLLLGHSARDLDLVVEGISVGGLQYAITPNVARKTSFGGLKARVGSFPIDIWAVQDTWALRQVENRLPATFQSLVSTTLLNTEAIVAVLPRKWPQEPHIIDGGFFTAMETGVVELNFEPNPAPALSVARAIRVADLLEFKVGPRLKQFISDTLESTDPGLFLSAQLKHFGRTILTVDEARLFIEQDTASRRHFDIQPHNLRINFDLVFS